jgi:hypothetical protein
MAMIVGLVPEAVGRRRVREQTWNEPKLRLNTDFVYELARYADNFPTKKATRIFQI